MHTTKDATWSKTDAGSDGAPVSALARFSYKFLAKMCPLNLAVRTIMMVCVYAALAYDAENLPGRLGRTFEPSTFLQVVFYISCFVNGALVIGYPLLRYFSSVPCCTWDCRKFYDVNIVVSVTLFMFMLVDWIKAYDDDVQNAGAVTIYQTHMYGVACTYLAFQVATIYAVVWCRGQAGSEKLPAEPVCTIANV